MSGQIIYMPLDLIKILMPLRYLASTALPQDYTIRSLLNSFGGTILKWGFTLNFFKGIGTKLHVLISLKKIKILK